MQPFSTPQFEVHPSSLGIALLLATALALLAVLVVVTVLLAAGKSIVPWQRVKVGAAMLALIAPALLLVGYIGLGTHTVHSERSQVRTAVPRKAKKTASNKSANRDLSNDGAPVDHDEIAKPGYQIPMPKKVTAFRTIDDGQTKSAVKVEVEDPPSDQSFQTMFEASPSELRRAERGPQPASAGEDGGAADDDVRQKSTDVLRVRQTSSTAPDWCEKDAVPSGDGVLVAVSSGRFATLDEAERQVTQRAVVCVKHFYDNEYQLGGEWTVPVALIRENAVNTFVGEVFDKDFGNGVSGKMYRAHLRLDMNSALRKSLHGSWNNQIASRRLAELGGLLGLATLTLASFAGYFRLDDLTDGHYRRRLKIAAAALISAGSLVAWQLLA